MSEFDENKDRSEETPGEQPTVQNDLPENEQPVSGQPEAESPEAEQPASEQPEEKFEPPAYLPEQPQSWAYSWDGQTSRKRSSGKGTRRFLIIAAACLMLSVAICLPIMLHAASGNRPASPSGDTSVPSSESESGRIDAVSSSESQNYDVSEVVKPSDIPYTEDSTLIRMYEKCAPSCCTIFTSSKTSSSLGSGFVLTSDGYIATNQHVVDGGTSFTVTFYDETEYSAKLVGEDPVRDLAVLKIDATGLTPMEIGDAEKLVVGQTVFAIGTPYDETLAGTMTMGIVSGVNRAIEITDDNGKVVKTMRLIQTDTSINPGNSGGPLLNLKGQIVGINSLKIVADYFEGIGFAIPINYACDIFNQLIQYGKVVNEPENDFVQSAAYLGVTVYNLEAGLDHFRIHPTCDYPKEGILVASVTPGTAIYAAGLHSYDIITKFCGVKITDVNALTKELSKHKAGETVEMEIFVFDPRFATGEYRTLTFVLDAAS